MFKLLVLAVVVAASVQAEVCFHGICDRLPTRKPLHCKGSVIKNGGFCGCFDVCAKQEGETCEAFPIRGRLSPGTCDAGLVCTQQDGMIIGLGKCQQPKKEDNSSNKSARSTRTLCEQRRILSMVSQIVYRGQWFPKCDAEGLFMPEQCNNIGECFCVDVHTGVVDETTKVLGSAECTDAISTTEN